MSWRLKKINRMIRNEVSLWRIRRSFVAELRDSDHFVVSYPKSGTHWLGFFLSRLLVDHIGYGEELLNLKEWQGIAPILDLNVTDALRIREFRSRPDPRTFLVHAPLDYALPRVTLLVRDPRAILISYFHHSIRTDPEFHGDLRKFAIEMIRGKLWPCDWQDMVQGWRDNLGSDRLLLVRYEDLHADPQKWFSVIARFAGFDRTPEDIREAILASSFRSMKSGEIKHGVDDGSKGDASVRFMRRGRPDSWKDEVPEEISNLICFVYRDLMEELGYL